MLSGCRLPLVTDLHSLATDLATDLPCSLPQLYHAVDTTQFNANFDPTNIRKLRIYIYQPSQLWRSLDVRRITCFSVQRVGDAGAPSTGVPRQVDSKRSKSELGDEVQQRLDQMLLSWRELFT